MKRRDLLQKLAGLVVAAPAAAALAEAVATAPSPLLLGMGISEAAARGLIQPPLLEKGINWAVCKSNTLDLKTYGFSVPVRDPEVLKEYQKLEAAARSRKLDPWDLLF